MNMSWQRVEAVLDRVSSTVRRINLLVNNNTQDVFELRAKIEIYEDNLEELNEALVSLAESNKALVRVCAHHMTPDGAAAVNKEAVKQGEAIAKFGRILKRNDSGSDSDNELKGIALLSE